MVRIKFFIYCCLVTTFTLAQSVEPNKIGITGGISYNTQVKSKNSFFPVSYAYYNTFSPFIGIVYQDFFTRYLSVSSNIYYIQRGVRYFYSYSTSFYQLKFNQQFTCHYISFPIKLKFNFHKFFVGLGLEGSILIKGHYYFQVEEKDNSAGISNNSKINRWYNDRYFQPVDAGYNLSLGYRLKHLDIEFSMFHGLVVPPKFFIFGSQHFEFQYLYQETFMLGLNYYIHFQKQKKQS